MRLLAILANLFRRKPAPAPPPSPPSPVSPPSPPSPAPISVPSSDFRATLLDLHNKARTNAGRGTLRESTLLDTSAQGWAQYMAQNEVMVHNTLTSTFTSRIEGAGYKYSTVGENIAEWYESAQAVFDGWMGDIPHRQNILNSSYVDVGFGMATDSAGRLYWCCDFGAPATGQLSESNGEAIAGNFPGGISKRWM